MAETSIEWTQRSWNPIVGCSIKSAGCTNCYAMKMAGRVEATGHPAYQGLTERSKAGFVWTGKLALNEAALLEPLHRRKPTTWFVNSMGDLFHEDCPDAWIDRVFAVMALCPQHTFQVLTKRSDRMREYLFGSARVVAWAYWAQAIWSKHLCKAGSPPKPESAWPLPNVWLGVSVEDQRAADERVPDLLATPAAVRWLSCEPLLGTVDLRSPLYRGEGGITMRGYLRDKAEPDDFHYWASKLDWIVVGGESGPGARPMHPDWARSLRDQCAAAGVPFFFKQVGEWVALTGPVGFWPHNQERACRLLPTGERHPRGISMQRVGKKRAGRLLDGVLHDAMPETTR